MLSAPPIIPATRQTTFRSGFTPALMGDTHLLAGQCRQPGPLRQRHHRDQGRPRYQIRVIKRRVNSRQIM